MMRTGGTMSALQEFPVETIIERGSIHDTDVAELRRLINEDGTISVEEANQLVRINAACPVQPAEWAEVFGEAMADYVVRQAEPEGYISRDNAEWLIASLAPDGVLSSRKNLDLVIEIMDRARVCPSILVSFALDAVRRAVIDAAGPLVPGERPAGTISPEDVELVRRIIYAFGGDGNIAVSRAEAELLCDINDSLDPAAASDSWTELYVKAMANYVLANAGYAPPSREEALRREVWLEERDTLSPFDFVRLLTQMSLDDVIGAYRPQSREECTLARLDREYRALLADEEVDDDEAQWLVERLMRDGELTPAEMALLGYLGENGIELDQRFEPLMQAVRNAA